VKTSELQAHSTSGFKVLGGSLRSFNPFWSSLKWDELSALVSQVLEWISTVQLSYPC
jgi:hypothetical protein